MSADKFKVKGKVVNVINSDNYKVLLKDNNMEIDAHVSGKMRINKIQILPGDTVEVEISMYDTTKGRITYREK